MESRRRVLREAPLLRDDAELIRFFVHLRHLLRNRCESRDNTQGVEVVQDSGAG